MITLASARRSNRLIERRKYVGRRLFADLAGLPAQCNDCSSRFFDRPAAHVDHRPTMARTKLPGICKFLRNDRTIHLSLGIIAERRAKCSVLSNMRDALGSRHHTYHDRPLGVGRALRDGHTKHDWDVRGLDAASWKIDAGWRVRRARNADKDDVGFCHVSRQLPVIMFRGEVERIDAAEI